MNATSNVSESRTEKCLVSFIIHSPSSSYISNSVGVCVFNVILAIAGTALNSLVLFIFSKSSKMRDKLSHFSIMVLSSIDLAVVTLVHPIFVVARVAEALGKAKCIYIVSFYVILGLLSGISSWTLFIINVERYLAIARPLWHHVWVTKSRFLLSCIVVWVFYTLNAVSAVLFYPLYISFIFASGVSFICCTTAYVYVSIFLVARKRLSSINRERKSCGRQDESRSLAVFLRDVKMAKTYVLIVSMAFFCYLPAGVVFGVRNPESEVTETRGSVALSYPWLLSCCSLSSTLNCLVLFWANRDLKKEGSKIVSKYFRVRHVR